MTRDALIDLLAARDPLAAVRALGVTPVAEVAVVRESSVADRFIDGATEGSVADHRRAHAEGRPSEATVAYGDGVTDAQIVDRLLALADLARDTGLLAAVTPVPPEGSTARPGSWGVEDLVVIAAVRGVVPGVAVRPAWRALGAAAAQVAVAFGATEWCVPDDDGEDLARLAGAAGCRLVAR